jgi:hypothetical protein
VVKPVYDSARIVCSSARYDNGAKDGQLKETDKNRSPADFLLLPLTLCSANTMSLRSSFTPAWAAASIRCSSVVH